MRRSALARSGKAPALRIRRLISVCRRSRLFVVRSRAQWGSGNRVELGGGREAPLKHVDCLGELLVPARRDLGQALLRLSEPGGPEDGGNLARHTLAQAMRDLGQHVALQVDSTALAAHLGQEAAHRGCQARVLIRDHELDAAETTLQELLEELRPAVLRFLRAPA